MTAYIVMDTQMPERLVEFYTELQGVEVLLAYDDGRYHALAPNREGLDHRAPARPRGEAGEEPGPLRRRRRRARRADAAGARSRRHAGSSRARPTSSKASGGAAWPIPRATSSAST